MPLAVFNTTVLFVCLLLILLASILQVIMFPGQHGQWHPPVYNDRILTITDATTPDPYVIWDNGVYYMTFTAGDRVEIWSADSLFDFERRAQKHVIWRPPPNTPYSGDLWAPELHSLQGRWYVYFAADDPVHGNKSHRMYVLAGPPSDHSPVSPNSWTFEGRLQGLPEDQWAIDGTVITLHGGLCFVYSGWPLGVTNDESKQEIFIIEMETPTMCIGQPIRISTPDNPWEYSGSSGINEGPQFLQSPDRRWIGLVYSCAGSWTHEYKMNLLQYTGSHPSHILHQQYWKKSRAPLLKASSDDTPPYGPGHGNFVVVSGPSGVPEVWAVFHATDAKTGWDGRKARVMRVGWGQEGPFMGSGECGSCGDVNYFLGYEGERSHGGGDGGQEQGIKGEPRGLVGEAKRLLNTFLK